MDEQHKIRDMLNPFCAVTGAAVEVLPVKRPKTKNHGEPDAAIVIKTGKHKARFWVELKGEIRDVHIAGILQKMREREKWLLVCQYIPAPVKEELRRQGVNYLEAAGNCSIRTSNILFFINDKGVTGFRGTKSGKLWKPAGLKFLFAILQDPSLVNATHRELARASGIALGNIGEFMDELKNEGFAKEGRRDGEAWLLLENKDQLINQWVELYNTILKA